ncbi:hypothetical protein BDR26DRAFT_865950, partial [Obelidium mucronatum]
MKGLSLSLCFLCCCHSKTCFLFLFLNDRWTRCVAKQVPLFKHNFICVKFNGAKVRLWGHYQLHCKPITAASSKCSTTCTSTRLGKAAVSWLGPLKTTNMSRRHSSRSRFRKEAQAR